MHQLADTVRNSLNFYRMQDTAETVERGAADRPRRRHPRLRRAPGRPSSASRSSRAVVAVEDAEALGTADAGRLTVAAGLAVEDR